MAPSSAQDEECRAPYFNYPECDLAYVDERPVAYNILNGIQAVLFLTLVLYATRSLLRISCRRGLPCAVESYQLLEMTVGNESI